MKRSRHALYLIRDYPNALRVRVRAQLRAPAAWEKGTRRPVVLIPGVYETWHFLQTVGDALNRRGHPVHIIPALGYNVQPIPRSAALVAAELAQRGLRGVAIVAHSKGGLIGKQLMATDDPEHRVDRLVAIASPFAGSGMARLTPVATLRVFLPTDEVIRQLAEARELNARVTSIYPRFDPHIPEGSRVDGATNIEVPVVGHFRVLDAPETIEAVIAAVEREGGAGGAPASEREAGPEG
jgi:pimeloyl-ACP methyl ester carboxylesterase